MYEFLYNKLKFTVDLDVYYLPLLDSSCLQNNNEGIEVESLLKTSWASFSVFFADKSKGLDRLT